jgi:uncharacterized membrane protein required for colicin V production
MHIVIDVLAGIILLFFLLAGWHKGFLLSLLGVARVILSYGIAYVSGRYLGFWLGEVTNRPRLVTIPVCAILAFVVMAFAFHVIMYEIRAHHQEKERKENFQLPIFSCLFGGAITLGVGVVSLVLLFWMGDLFLVGVAGSSIPGAEQARFGRFARRSVYEAAYALIPKKDNEQQVAALARLISSPADGMRSLENVLSAESVQQLLSDKQFAEDLLSGDAGRIQQNASIQRLFNDRATLDELREVGLLSGYETQSGICEKMAKFGQNQQIQSSIENLKAKQLLSTDKIPLLVRDPDFDTILVELLK